ncbi:MAG: glycosyltransferase family 2 protein [Candidatus Aenigmarchaeota archaeon]|nr:glycosyltransferase family 2 protein [Candidatus Aenigmarchaeota archaeon]
MIIAVMPAHNEEKCIEEIVLRTRKHVDKIILIDDASTDKTYEIARRLPVVLIRHGKNKGLGSALRSGFRKALSLAKNDDDIIITIDADGQHLPEEIPKFVRKIRQGYDFVLGCRDLGKYPLVKRIGNKFLSAMTNLFSCTSLKDTESGFRAFTRRALTRLNLKAERYEIAVEIIREIGRNKIKSANVYIDSPVYVKGVGIRDGIKNFLYIFKC